MTEERIHRTRTQEHAFPVHVHRQGNTATLLGWASSEEVAERLAREFEARPPISFEELMAP